MELYSSGVSPVKSPSGSLRAERAAVTRRRIAEAARALFATRGYAATTLREIAVAADVAVQTVYAVFGSKARILAVLLEDLRDDPPADAAFAAALAAPDRAQALTLFARSIRLRWEAGHDLVAIHADAASADPAIRAGVEGMLAARRRGIAELAAAVAGPDAAPGETRRLAAIIDALTLPAQYEVLVGTYRWTADAYEAGLATALRTLVVAARPGPAGV